MSFLSLSCQLRSHATGMTQRGAEDFDTLIFLEGAQSPHATQWMFGGHSGSCRQNFTTCKSDSGKCVLPRGMWVFSSCSIVVNTVSMWPGRSSTRVDFIEKRSPGSKLFYSNFFGPKKKSMRASPRLTHTASLLFLTMPEQGMSAHSSPSNWRGKQGKHILCLKQRTQLSLQSTRKHAGLVHLCGT